VLLGDLLEGLEPLDVVLERLATGAGTRRRDRVGRLHEDSLDRLRLDVLVVGLDRVHDALRLAVLLGELLRDLGVRAVHLMVDRLADVVEEAGAPGDLDVRAELGRHDAGEVGHLDRVVEDVLTVARPVLEASEELDELGRQAVHVGVEARLFAGLLDRRFDLGLSLGVCLLDARRVDAPVGDELRQREAGDLAAHAVEAREDDGLGRVVDDEVDTGDVLEGADVAPLAADDAALHVVGGQVDDGDGRLGDMVGRRPLDAQREDVARPPVGLATRLLLDLAHELGHVVSGLLLGPLEQLLARLRRAHPRDALQGPDDLLASGLDLLGQLLDVRLAVAQRLVAPVLLDGARLELLLALDHALLGAGQLRAPLAQLLLDLAADLVDLFLGLEPSLLEDGLGLATGVADEPLRLALGRRRATAGQGPTDEVSGGESGGQRHHHVQCSHHLAFPSLSSPHEKSRARRPACAALAPARDTENEDVTSQGSRHARFSTGPNLPNLSA